MSPIVRGRILAEIENGGQAKHTLDVLLWLPNLNLGNCAVLDEVCVLKEYLRSLVPHVCDVRFHVPDTFGAAKLNLAHFDIATSDVPIAAITDAERAAFKDGAPSGLLEACATAVSCDCDLIFIREPDWFAYWRELDSCNLLAVDGNVLKRQCEIFVRGHNLPWSFDGMVWNQSWTSFYMMVERQTFAEGFRFLEACQKTNLSTASETGRMLIYNRLPSLCFTRDRLLFYELQRRAAKRAHWTHQNFTFEVGYYLEFYYLLIFGGLDSIAVLLNYALNLGLRLTQVAAQSKVFLQALKGKAPEIHAGFVDLEFAKFLGRIASLRHLAAHRGSIMQGPVYEEPDVELTNEEIDREIARQGLDSKAAMFPEGPVRDWILQTLRHRIKLEMSKKVLDDVLLIEIKGQHGFISPMSEIEWTFNKYYTFMAKVLATCLHKI